MDYDQIEQRFQNELRFAVGHEVFTASSFLDLLRHVELGAQAMVTEGRTTEAQFDLARQGLHRVLNEMRSERERLGFAEFREETVSRTFANLCPGLWPFC